MIGKDLAHIVGREEPTEQVNGVWCGHWSGGSAGIISRDVSLRREKREAKAHDEVRRRGYRVRLKRRSCVDGLGALQFRKCVDGFACFLLGEAQVVEALQIEPKLGAGTEEVTEAEGRVASNQATPLGFA